MEQLMASNTHATSATADLMSNDEVVDVLNDLLENSHDGEYGFRACAEEVDSAQLKQVFQSHASQCASAASELAGLIRQLGGKPDEGGSVSGAMHRGRVHVKGMGRLFGAHAAGSTSGTPDLGTDRPARRFQADSSPPCRRA
jgi:hypothetical protein